MQATPKLCRILCSKEKWFRINMIGRVYICESGPGKSHTQKKNTHIKNIFSSHFYTWLTAAKDSDYLSFFGGCPVPHVTQGHPFVIPGRC